MLRPTFAAAVVLSACHFRVTGERRGATGRAPRSTRGVVPDRVHGFGSAAKRLARYGGDEFAMVLPDTTLSRAPQVIDRFRGATPDVSFSAGIAQAS